MLSKCVTFFILSLSVLFSSKGLTQAIPANDGSILDFMPAITAGSLAPKKTSSGGTSPDETPADEGLLCPDRLSVILGVLSPPSGQSQSRNIFNVADITSVDAPVIFGGTIIWSVSGLDGTDLTLTPSSGRFDFLAEGDAVSGVISASIGAQPAEIPVIFDYTIIMNDESGKQCSSYSSTLGDLGYLFYKIE